MDEDIKEILEKSKRRDRTLRSRFGESIDDDTVYYEAESSDRTPRSPLSSSNNSLFSARSTINRLGSPSVTKVESEMQGTKETPTRYLNIHKENLQMEIKLTSMDNCKVHVEIHDDENNTDNIRHIDDDNDEVNKKISTTDLPNKSDHLDDKSQILRSEVKNKLNRLAKLYSDAENSSPIHKTEDKFSIESPVIPEKLREKAISGIRIGKLAALAQTINDWEDDTKHSNYLLNSRFSSDSLRNSKQSLSSSSKSIISTTSSDSKNNSSIDKSINLDKSVLDTLEAQGYKRIEDTSKLVYNYEEKPCPEEETKENILVHSSKQESSSKDFTEKRSYMKTTVKDPSLLSVSERKALFEKSLGNPTIQKLYNINKTNEKLSTNSDKVKSEKSVNNPILKAPKIHSILDEEVNTDRPFSRNSLVAIRSSKIASRVAAIFEEKSKPSNLECNETKVLDISNQESEQSLQKVEKPFKSVKIVDVKMKSPYKSLMDDDGVRKTGLKDSAIVKTVLEDVKKIRVSPAREGNLYPNVSDIETATETETSTTVENSENSSNPIESVTFDGENTLIDEAINMDNGQGNDSFNQTISKKRPNDSDSATTISDLSNLLMNDVDEYLGNETFVLEGPTPPKLPKRIKNENDSSDLSSSFCYKSFNEYDDSSRNCKQDNENKDESSTSLMHTVSFYRKQQNQSANNTPLKVVFEQQIIVEEDSDNYGDNEDSGLIQKKITELTEEVSKQQAIISQTSQALNFCCSTVEFSGSSEHVEAEKLLLVATHKRQAFINEIQRLKVEKSLRSKNREGTVEDEYGILTVSNIRIPLKQTYSKALKSVGGKGHHILCLLRCDENIVASQLVSTVATNDSSPVFVEIPGSIVLNPVYADFTAELEFYSLQAQDEFLSHEDKYHIKKSIGHKLAPKILKSDPKLTKLGIQSPGGPRAVRTSEFTLMGYVMFSLQTIKKSTWTLNNVSQMSPLDGTVQMKITCQLLTCIEYKGFLTIFNDVSGFGNWHRRWCHLKGHILNFWMYPDDEKQKEPLKTIDLRRSITEDVKPVNRELCARQNTLLIECIRDKEPGDIESLTTMFYKDQTILRYLLSADTKDERNEWCEKFTKAIKAIHAWGANIY